MNKQYYLEKKEEIEDAFQWLGESRVICTESHNQWQFIARRNSIQKDCIYFCDDYDSPDSLLYILAVTTDDVSIEEVQEKLDVYFKEAEYPEFEDFFNQNNIEFDICFYNPRVDYQDNTICIRKSERRFITINETSITDTSSLKGESIAISGFQTFKEFVNNLSDKEIKKMIELSETENNDLLALSEFIYSFDIYDFDTDIFEIIANYAVLKQIEKGLIGTNKERLGTPLSA